MRDLGFDPEPGSHWEVSRRGVRREHCGCCVGEGLKPGMLGVVGKE